MIYAVIVFLALFAVLALALVLLMRRDRAVGRRLEQELRRYGWESVGDVPERSAGGDEWPTNR